MNGLTDYQAKYLAHELTRADDEVYDLIMKDKERLLSMDEPLRFIFSHSALREDWDNPNLQPEGDERTNRVNKQVRLSPEFAALWERIKPRTTYRVEFEAEKLVSRAADAVRVMSRVEAPSVLITTAQVEVKKAGVAATATRVSVETAGYSGPLPDILAYLQNETELTRSDSPHPQDVGPPQRLLR